MRGGFLKGALVGFVCAVLGGATVALAGSGIGGVFNLGVSNSVDAKTTLTGASPATQLQVTNTSAAAGTSGLAVNSGSGAMTAVFTNTGGGPAGGFFVNAGVKPFTVNSSTKVGNLNADLLDGLDSPALQKRVTGTCAAGSAVRVVSANGSVSCQAVGTGSGGWSLTGNAGTSPGANFLGTADAHDLVVKTNGSEALRVTQTGDVGIGTTTPSAKLHSHGGFNAGWFFSTGANGNGLIAEADSGANAYGLYALSNEGYAGTFAGKVQITGNLSVGGTLNVSGTKNFRIDDPLDPANKYLVHASIESDQALDVYTGNVTTDRSGLATVQLPEWFDRINTDFRYQLTIVGSRGWNARVGKEIADNRFTIETDEPNVQVSWQVTARRNDPYLREHPFQAEQAKTGLEQGRYVDPEAYGRPASDGIGALKPTPRP
jgi:hypothetical protein